MAWRAIPGRKYRNQPVGGYDSRRELRRASELRLMERARVISELREQVVFELIPKQAGERAAHYIADFVYKNEHGETVVEDTKGFRTPEYILKRKLMLFRHGIKITEV